MHSSLGAYDQPCDNPLFEEEAKPSDDARIALFEKETDPRGGARNHLFEVEAKPSDDASIALFEKETNPRGGARVQLPGVDTKLSDGESYILLEKETKPIDGTSPIRASHIESKCLQQLNLCHTVAAHKEQFARKMKELKSVTQLLQATLVSLRSEELKGVTQLLQSTLVSLRSEVTSQQGDLSSACQKMQLLLADVEQEAGRKVYRIQEEAGRKVYRIQEEADKKCLKADLEMAQLRSECQAKVKAVEIKHCTELSNVSRHAAALKKAAHRSRATMTAQWLVMRQDVKKVAHCSTPTMTAQWLVMRQDVKVQMNSVAMKAAWHTHEHQAVLKKLEKELTRERAISSERKSEAAIQVSQTQLEDYEAALQDQADYAIELDAKLAVKDKKIAEQKALLDQLQEGLQSAEIAEQKALLDQLQEGLQSVEVKLHMFEQRCAVLEQQLRDKMIHCEDCAQQFGELKQQTEDMQTQVDQIPVYANQLNQAKQVIQELMQRFKLGEEQNAQLAAEISKKGDQLSEADWTNSELRTTIKHLEQETTKLVEANTLELAHRLNDVTMLAEENAKLCEELKALRPSRSPLPLDAKYQLGVKKERDATTPNPAGSSPSRHYHAPIPAPTPSSGEQSTKETEEELSS
eukprot:gene25749-11412_t